MEYADDATAQAAYVSSSEPSSWDMIDDCSSVTGWTMTGPGGGDAPVQITFDGKSTFKFNCSGGGTQESKAVKDFGTINGDFTFDVDVYFDALGTVANTDHIRFMIKNGTNALMVEIGTDKVTVYDGASYVQVGTPTITQDAWQTWRFVVDNTAETVDIYRYNWDSGVWDVIATGADCSAGNGTPDGDVWINLYGYNSAVRCYIDEFRIETAKHPPDLACFSEDTEKEQGDYSLKAVAKQTGSLNDTLTRTIGSPIDLSDQTEVKLDVRASRTGSQFKMGIHDSGGTTTEHTVNIAEANVWQTETWDISGVSNVNKDDIDEIIITIMNADSDNLIYVDNVYTTGNITILPSTLALALTQYTPSLAFDYTVTPSVLSLTLALQVPTAIVDCTIIPTTLGLLLSLEPSLVDVFYPEIPPFMHKDLIDPYSGGAWLWLFEISVPGYEIQRQARNPANIIYGGMLFPKGNFNIGKQSLVSDASIPSIVLQVAQESDRVLENIVNATKGCEDGTAKIIRTCEKYLDIPIDELEADYDILTAGSDSQWVTFVLGIPNPLMQRFPLWLYSSKVCPLATPSLFKGPRCQYSGGDSVCTGLFEDCYLKGNAVHWGAEIGLDPNAVRA